MIDFTKTGTSAIDVWTTVHFAFWFFVGSVLWPLGIHRFGAVAGGVFFALAWEFFERFAEKKWPQLWLHPESWMNSYVSDLLTVPAGILLVYFLLDRYAR